MKKLSLVSIGIILLCIWLSACSAFSPQPVPPGSIIMADDFSEDEGRWLTTIEADYSMVGYQAGVLRCVVNRPNAD